MDDSSTPGSIAASPFTKPHFLKSSESSFFQIHCCQGNDQLQALDLFVYRGRPGEWVRQEERGRGEGCDEKNFSKEKPVIYKPGLEAGVKRNLIRGDGIPGK